MMACNFVVGDTEKKKKTKNTGRQYQEKLSSYRVMEDVTLKCPSKD